MPRSSTAAPSPAPWDEVARKVLEQAAVSMYDALGWRDAPPATTGMTR